MNNKSIYAIANEYLADVNEKEEYELSLSAKALEDRIKNYISNCMSALGASLSAFTRLRRFNSFEVTPELEEHIITLLNANLKKNCISPLISKKTNSNGCKYTCFW